MGEAHFPVYKVIGNTLVCSYNVNDIHSCPALSSDLSELAEEFNFKGIALLVPFGQEGKVQVTGSERVLSFEPSPAASGP